MKIRVAAILLWLILLSRAAPAFAAPAWSIDIRQPSVPEAGDIIGCLELSCHGDVPLIVDGAPHIVHVEAFLDGPVARLAFADQGWPPFGFQFTQSNPLVVAVHRGLMKISVALATPDAVDPDFINRVLGPSLASLSISIKLIGYRYEPPSTLQYICPHCWKPISQEP